LKFLKESYSNDERARRRFLREARSASAMCHPNVIVIHDVFEDDGVPVMVMDLLEGESLAEHLKRSGSLSLHDTAAMMQPVISAVQAAHSVGVIHRDLKPDNIFLVRSPSTPEPSLDVRVLDFGIAKITSDLGDSVERNALTSAGALLGTPFYMSPEQFFGDGEIDHRSDIWAIGVILYECLAGVRPTEAKSVGLIAKVIMSESIAPIEQHNAQLPADVSAIIMRAISFDGDKRPTLFELAEVLGQYTSVRTEDSALTPARPSTQAPLLLPETRGPVPRRLFPRLLIGGVGLVALIALMTRSSGRGLSDQRAAAALDSGFSSATDKLTLAPLAAAAGDRAPSSEAKPADGGAIAPRTHIAKELGATPAAAAASAKPKTTRATTVGEVKAKPFDPGSVR